MVRHRRELAAVQDLSTLRPEPGARRAQASDGPPGPWRSLDRPLGLREATYCACVEPAARRHRMDPGEELVGPVAERALIAGLPDPEVEHRAAALALRRDDAGDEEIAGAAACDVICGIE